MRTLAWMVILCAGCGDGTGGTDPDMSAAADLTVTGNSDLGNACSPTDPMTDQQDCTASTAVCSTSTVPVILPGGACRCLYKCDPAAPTTCPCSRRCLTLTAGDAGVIGGGCYPANGPAERCGANMAGMPFGKGTCAQNLSCAGRSNGPAFCLYQCNSTADCPRQTQCAPITNGMGMMIGLACQYLYGAAGKAPGEACQPTDACQENHVCDGTCKPQCDGPGATCASGTCTALTDQDKGNKVIAWICR
jgi:hypothetical protein